MLRFAEVVQRIQIARANEHPVLGSLISTACSRVRRGVRLWKAGADES
jgi:hypothetical protein